MRTAVVGMLAAAVLAGCAGNAKQEWGSFEYNPNTGIVKGDGIVGIVAAEKFADAEKGYETCDPELSEGGEIACQVRLARGAAPQQLANKSAGRAAAESKNSETESWLNAGVQVAGITGRVILGTAIADTAGDFLTALVKQKRTQSLSFGDVYADDQSEMAFQIPIDGSQAAHAEGDVQQAFGDLAGRDNLPTDEGIGGQPLFEFPRGDTTVEEGGTVEEAAPTIESDPAKGIEGRASLGFD